jgi:iron(III) transport system ATP-binding protein
LADVGTTALLVTHDQDEALSLSDNVAVIEDGRIAQCDTPVGLYARPASPGLARALGEANFLSGTVRGTAVETPLGMLRLDRERRRYEDGTALLVLVRPEQIDLVPVLSGGATARVLQREYYGHDAVVRARAERAPEMTLTVRIADVANLPEVGALVGVSVHGAVAGWPAPSRSDPS